MILKIGHYAVSFLIPLMLLSKNLSISPYKLLIFPNSADKGLNIYLTSKENMIFKLKGGIFFKKKYIPDGIVKQNSNEFSFFIVKGELDNLIFIV